MKFDDQEGRGGNQGGNQGGGGRSGSGSGSGSKSGNQGGGSGRSSNSNDDSQREFGGALNQSWDGIWTVRVRRGGDGWTVEMEIPFSTLNFDPNDPNLGWQWDTMRVQPHRRYVKQKDAQLHVEIGDAEKIRVSTGV